MNRWIGFYSTYDLIIISMMAALGIATKPIIVPLTHMITGPLMIPGGAVAGGFYMLWIILGGALVQKRGAATLTSLVQAIIVIVSSVYGTHGIASVLTYTMPGLAIDVLWFFIRGRGNRLIDCFLGGIIANLTGTYLSNLVFFKLPIIPLLLSLSSAAISGGLGGIIAYNIMKKITQLNKKGRR